MTTLILALPLPLALPLALVPPLFVLTDNLSLNCPLNLPTLTRKPHQLCFAHGQTETDRGRQETETERDTPVLRSLTHTHTHNHGRNSAKRNLPFYRAATAAKTSEGAIQAKCLKTNFQARNANRLAQHVTAKCREISTCGNFKLVKDKEKSRNFLDLAIWILIWSAKETETETEIKRKTERIKAARGMRETQRAKESLRETQREKAQQKERAEKEKETTRITKAIGLNKSLFACFASCSCSSGGIPIHRTNRISVIWVFNYD